VLAVKHISSGGGQRGPASPVAADRHEQSSGSQPLCCPCHEICRWLPASHQADGSGVATCWFTKVWATHTNYRRQRALTTSIWWAMKAIVRDTWKQREIAFRHGGSGAASGAMAELGAAMVPSPTLETHLLCRGHTKPWGPTGQKHLLSAGRGRRKQEGLESVSRDDFIVFFFFSPLLRSV